MSASTFMYLYELHGLEKERLIVYDNIYNM